MAEAEAAPAPPKGAAEPAKGAAETAAPAKPERAPAAAGFGGRILPYVLVWIAVRARRPLIFASMAFRARGSGYDRRRRALTPPHHAHETRR